jgi:hypothetical protein
MEGYLTKKTQGEQSFSSRWLTDKNKSWTKMWFVLDDQTVTYYEEFNVISGEPVEEKGYFSVVGCEILPVAHNTKKNIFCIKERRSKNTLLYAQAEDARMMGCKIIHIFLNVGRCYFFVV